MPVARCHPSRLLWPLLALLCAALLVAPVEARKIAGYVVRETIIIPDGNFTELILHGAGVRDQGLFSVYIGALYLQGVHRGALTPEQVYNAAGPKRIAMRILYSHISAASMIRSWHEGLRDNLDAATRERLRQPLNDFVALFPDLVEGDRVDIDFYPDGRVVLLVNSEKQGEVQGERIDDALLSVWLGPEPADEDLKEALLGAD